MPVNIHGDFDAGTPLLDGEFCCLGSDVRSMSKQLLFRGPPNSRPSICCGKADRIFANGRHSGARKSRRISCLSRPRRSCSPPTCREPAFRFSGRPANRAWRGTWRNGKTHESDERSAAWVKIKNPEYSQIRGRHEPLERGARRTGQRSSSAPSSEKSNAGLRFLCCEMQLKITEKFSQGSANRRRGPIIDFLEPVLDPTPGGRLCL